MPDEIEIKLRIDDPDALRRRLRGLHADLYDPLREINRIFDFPDHRLRDADSALRVRVVYGEYGDEPLETTLTYKGPRQPGEPPRREQIEIEVGDPEVIVALLERLGLREQIRYEKRREPCLLTIRPLDGGNLPVEVLLDELPRVGWFAEIEAPTPEAVLEAARRLGLDPAQRVRETYVELAAEHGEPDTKGVRVLAFEQEGGR